VPEVPILPPQLAARALALDERDPLASHRSLFIQTPEVIAYLDGNSLGRPLISTREHLHGFVDRVWAKRLIRAWDEGWMDAPTELGDMVARVTLGAAPGQTVVADSTTVMLYKLMRGAVAARPDRDQIIADTQNFPTDRFILQGVAAECGLTIRWIDPDPGAGVTVSEVQELAGERTALVLLSHIGFRSGYIADMRTITEVAHAAGALVLWDLCHSVGSVPIELDGCCVDLAVGCTYKYLNGGPGAPAFAYVSERIQDQIRQPIQGWMGSADPFAMGPGYEPATGIRQLVSGTPPIVGMVAMRAMLALIEEVGIAAVRAKSVALTEFAIELTDQLLEPLGVRLCSPRDSRCRGGHVTIEHPRFRELTAELWSNGVIPDFRPPNGIRVGLSPLSTSFAEVAVGIEAIADALKRGD
jgi:kynureninase